MKKHNKLALFLLITGIASMAIGILLAEWCYNAPTSFKAQGYSPTAQEVILSIGAGFFTIAGAVALIGATIEFYNGIEEGS